MADVEPLARPRRIAPPKPLPAPVARERAKDESAVLAELLVHPIDIDDSIDSGDELVYLAPGIARSVVRRLRRGHWVTEAEVDLHGLTQPEAAGAIAAFLRTCLARGRRCVRVIHGKGLGSKNREPVLKGKVKHWLMQRDEVLAYCQAPPMQGGGGAMLVLLRG